MSLLLEQLPPRRIRIGRALRNLPDRHAISRLTERERHAFYLHAVKAAWEDGKMRIEERVFLEHLRQDLGLSLDASERLEEKAYATS